MAVKRLSIEEPLRCPLKNNLRLLHSGSYQAPWSSLGECGEQYCLVWESRFLWDLGSAMISLLDGLVSMVAQEALKYTVLSGTARSPVSSEENLLLIWSWIHLNIFVTVSLSGIVTALTWPASLLAVASIIDNPWCVCLNRSAEVGKHLAQVLRSRQQVGPHRHPVRAQSKQLYSCDVIVLVGEFKIAVSVLTFQTKCLRAEKRLNKII